ncbi:uncharacterized protein PHACADRAFT_261388 [Phanerochaete carnosa HHB-10118-sp]|uniref:Uncharacterized protein n=1 Tax=Phanerochaete carnosa (strain HHB-10118-sp) TaxID=650164 RepID=K5W0Z4_PHACS|nr:uncharacterized protein PHACADRAFT_261388 [Phanerochaete carnosa HHB-10118-sp]EKM52770.1 hypothetical protein PHACADRAFT_261388 [Phanerochaete carnosa HHB-10118-sp]
MGANAEQIKLLEKYTKQLSTTLQHPAFKDDKGCSEDLRQRIDTLEKQLTETTEKIRALASRSRLTRLLGSDSHAGAIDEYIRQISWAINDFVIGGTISLELAVGVRDSTLCHV